MVADGWAFESCQQPERRLACQVELESRNETDRLAPVLQVGLLEVT